MTSYYGVQTQSEVFAELERIARKEGFVKEAADEKAESSKDKYSVTGGKGEDEINSAHPGGGTTAAEAQGDYGKVETLLEQHKVFEDIATKNSSGKLAYVVNVLQKIATAIEEEGLQSEDMNAFKVGKILDDAVDRLVSLAGKKKGPGIPDGTGPLSGTDECPKSKKKKDKDEDKDDKKKDKKKKKDKDEDEQDADDEEEDKKDKKKKDKKDKKKKDKKEDKEDEQDADDEDEEDEEDEDEDKKGKGKQKKKQKGKKELPEALKKHIEKKKKGKKDKKEAAEEVAFTVKL